MLYVQQSLSPDEKLIHVGQFHWAYDVAAAMNIVIWSVIAGVILAIGIYLPQYVNIPFIEKYPDPNASLLQQVRDTDPIVRIVAFLAFLIGIGKFAQMMIIKATTEIAVTTSRVVYKRGVVARYVGEISINRIEGCNVLQSFFGRILNYGRVMVRGMGVGEVVLPTIEDPVTFRKAIFKAQSLSRKS